MTRWDDPPEDDRSAEKPCEETRREMERISLRRRYRRERNARRYGGKRGGRP